MSSLSLHPKMSTCVATCLIFLLAMAATATAFCHLQEVETIQMLQSQIVEARNYWAQSSIEPRGESGGRSNWGHANVSVALRDCAKLYAESESRLEPLLASDNYTSDDARTWLSGVLANHRTCLDGLKEKGHVGSQAVTQNLTLLLSEALSLHGKGRLRKGVPPSKPIDSKGGKILASWSPATSKADIVVAQDGSGTHTTIRDAVAALGRMGRRRTRRLVVYVKAGVYNEKVEIGRHIRNVMFVGDGIDRTIVTGNRNVPDGATTLSSATFGVWADGFWARDMTFENTAGPHKQQAVALRVSSDRSVFYRCSFRAYQDTLYVHSLRQFYLDCHVYGTVDFIFGDAPVVFQNCDIFVRRPMKHQANIITAQGREDPNENTGISIQRSRVRPSQEFIAVKDSFRSYLGRPWKKYSRTAFLETDLDGLIDPSGWKEWDGDFALSTLFYAEYMNTGVGASTGKRVKWSGFHVLRSAREASPFTVTRLIQGESWIPATGVPYWIGI